MTPRIGIGLATLGISVSCFVGLQAATAVQLRDGTVHFVQPPRLLNAKTTQSGTYVWGATYYFTLAIPETAGEPLQRVTIAQREGVETVRYDAEETFAFIRTDSKERLPVPLGQVTADRKARTLTLLFEPPINPGETVTIGLRPRRNPGVSGVYLFGVTAFPTGEQAHGQFLGYGRLHFYDSFDSGLFGDRWWR